MRVNDPDPPLTRWSQAKPRAGRRDEPVIEPTPNSGCNHADRPAECSYSQAPDTAIHKNSKTTLRFGMSHQWLSGTSQITKPLGQVAHDPVFPGASYT